MAARRYISLLLLLLGCVSAYAESDWISKGLHIPSVEVVGQRPMREVGEQRTKFDSVMLKENVALSMADVLAFNSSIFVKSYGRATLSTVSFRGTSPSHTQVSWNGMKINSPMLGMTDFSTIPAYFIDDASLLHGASSVGESGGGLGGAVRLTTKPTSKRGFGLQYVQGAGSFLTFDEFLRLTYATDRWQLSTRAVFSSSRNDFKYRNRDKKMNIYDDEMNIIGQYYPVERNKSGSFKDLHILQEAYYNTGKGSRVGLSAWYMNSNRELPMITADYGEDTEFDNRQREHTFRGVVSFDHIRRNWKIGAKGGYIYTWLAYDYKRDAGNGVMMSMTRSRSRVHTTYASVESEYHIDKRLFVEAKLSLHQHFVRSEDKNIVLQDGDRAIVGYNTARAEFSAVVSARYRPHERVGIGATIREESYGSKWTLPIPALFFDATLSKKGNLVFKASATRNYRYPTLNDLYFLPGGNPNLRAERGWSYDAGLSFSVGKSDVYKLSGSANWFDSYIDDWIIWLPTTKGFFSPRNVKRVHAYGVESELSLSVRLARDWRFEGRATYSFTPSVNCGEKMSEADRSVGKQLPYVPRHSASATAKLSFRSWSLLYKWNYYSTRYTMSSNDYTLTGTLPPYFMNNIALEKSFSFRWADLSLKGAINNHFDEEYLSVLSRPMPGINFEIFVGITPKWEGFRRRK